MKKIVTIIVWLIIACRADLFAQLSLPKIIGNNMVLQRNQPVPIWGFANAGDKVMVRFGQQQKNIITDNAGNWKIMLDAMSASSVPQQLIVTTATEKIVLENILVGEVWLCSGQSNMEYSMRKNSKVTVPPGETGWPVNELETAHNKSIRIFLVERKKMKPDSTHSGWSVAEDSALRSFSAVGYFFAKKMYEELKVPVGIISSAIPGSRIEPWMPEEAFTTLPFFRDKTDSTHKIDGEPGKFYQTMIAPIAPFALKGFLWYQGESNCFLNERIQYSYKMLALINQWRKIWGHNDLPFYFVQIAPFAYSKQKGNYTEQSLPEFWEAQALASKAPHTAIVTTTDLNFDLENLHPHFKWEIGKRLALAALSDTYKRADIIGSGPFYSGMRVQGNHIDISFTGIGTGLTSKDGQPVKGFTIAGKDGKFVTATAVIKSNMVQVSSSLVAAPVNVRFNWNEADRPNLYNKEGLPAYPFRTDNPLTQVFSLEGVR